MNKLIAFLKSRANFFVFLLLEVTALVIYYSQSPYHSAVFFNSSNAVTSSFLAAQVSVRQYFNVMEQNQSLVYENTQLKNRLHKMEYLVQHNNTLNADTAYYPFRYLSAKVLQSTTAFNHNYVTVNKGYAQGVQVGMGVVSSKGVVGKVKSCSENFATITSVLHSDMLVSSRLKKVKVLGALKWDGKNVKTAKLMYIPRHIKVNVGDTVVTSEENSIFPYGIMVGIVERTQTLGDNNFIDIDVTLATDFVNIDYVYILQNSLKTELDSLQSKTTTAKSNVK